MAEADAVRRALDETRNVGHDETLLIVRLDDAEHGRDRREMIFGNLRPCGRDRGHEARLADARIADEADISKQFELEDQVLRLARFAELRKRRSAIRCIREFRIAAAAATALCDDGFLPDFREVGDEFSRRLVAHRRSGRDFDDAWCRIRAVLVLDVAVLAIIGLEFPMIAEIEQRVHIRIDAEDDIAAAPAIAARRAAFRHELLAAERRLAMPAVASLDDDLGFVDKLHVCFLYNKKYPRHQTGSAGTLFRYYIASSAV